MQKIEINQLMLYHQISVYQTSRDIFKSIKFYYYLYLNLKQVNTNKFEKLKAIIKYLEEKDIIKLESFKIYTFYYQLK